MIRPDMDRAALLRQAATVLEMAWPATTATFHREGAAFRVRFEYPACVVAVYERNSGELVARSIPGLPRSIGDDRS